jgi:hypothetical protein
MVVSGAEPTALEPGKAMLCMADKGKPFFSIEESRVDRISELSE